MRPARKHTHEQPPRPTQPRPLLAMAFIVHPLAAAASQRPRPPQLHRICICRLRWSPCLCWLLPALQKNRDKYGRVVGVCSLNGEDLNGWLVEQGLAVAYRWVVLRPLDLLVCNLTSVPGCGGGLPG